MTGCGDTCLSGVWGRGGKFRANLGYIVWDPISKTQQFRTKTYQVIMSLKCYAKKGNHLK